jgi:glycosyltransferase involved in cell wall biosynthesis
VIALLHATRAEGAVERYVDQIAEALGDDGVLVDAQDETSLRELVRILRRLRPRVAHVMDVWPQAVVAARLARVPRVVVTHHTPELPRRDNLAGRVWQRLGWLARPEVIYTSEADRERDGRRPSRVIALGIDLDRFEDAQPALRSDAPLVGNVARLAPQKDHRTLIEAARLVPDAEFVVAGEGELREELERLAEGSRVRFLGAREDVPELLASFDVFAFPSLFEGLCLAVIEAQAAGVPVVATPAGAIRETVVDGETGLLVPMGDPPALAAGIRRLLEDLPAAKAMAAEAKRRVRERFSVGRMVDETLRLYGIRRAKTNA